MLVTHLPQIAVAERSYGDLGFLLTKNKGFLRKDVSQSKTHTHTIYGAKCSGLYIPQRYCKAKFQKTYFNF
jgi:hypothetical protein